MEKSRATMYTNEGDTIMARLFLHRDHARGPLPVDPLANRLIWSDMTAEHQVADEAFGNDGGLSNAAIQVGANMTLGQSQMACTCIGIRDVA